MAEMLKPSDPADKDAGVDQFQQVNRRAGYGNKYEMIYRFAKKGATLAAGEGAQLVAEIERLEIENAALREQLAVMEEREQRALEKQGLTPL